jgi:hypothetical protein
MKHVAYSIILLISLLLLLYPVLAVENRIANVPRTTAMLHGQVDIIVSSCSAAGLTLSSLTLPAVVEKVRLGSSALYAGVEKGDKILSAQKTDKKLCVLIERKGQKFYAQLKTSAQTDRVLDTRIVSTLLSTPETVIQITDKRTDGLRDLLLNHDLALIIDRSGSMVTTDCPDYPDYLNYISRWDWCSKQSTTLAQVAASAASSITVTLFNQTYNVWQNVRTADIPFLFSNNSPDGGTLLAPPLQERLTNFFVSGRKKPLIILIISDGMPQDSPDVATALQNASKQVRYPGELTIIFLLIGSDINNNELRTRFGELDAASIKNGGMFDVIPFISVSSKGIKQALLDEFSIVGAVIDTPKPSKAGESATGHNIQRPQRSPIKSSKLYIHQY